MKKVTRALKHLFIPHEHNEYKPHFFREISLAILVALSIFLLGVSAGSSFFLHRTVLGANVTASVLIDLTNESRIAYNQAPLVRNPLLDTAAQLKAKDMATVGYFAHNSPQGITPWHWFQQVGYIFLYAGENLAINFTDATAVRDAWLASPKHRENLLDVRFREIGMATLEGLYKNDPTIYVVQLFGTPAIAAQSETASAPLPASITTVAQANPPLFQATQPEIRGETETRTPEPKEQDTLLQKYVPLVETKELAIVKNTEALQEAPVYTKHQVPEYSTWYERLWFGSSYYVQLFFKGLLIFVAFALILMIVIEIRRQHFRHIAYGLAILLVLTLCILINQTFF